MQTILEEAQGLVRGDRAKQYGDAGESYGRIASMFSTLTGKEITAAEAVTFMILVKLDREQHRPKRDNRVDGAGYFEVLDQVQQSVAVTGSPALQDLPESGVLPCSTPAGKTMPLVNVRFDQDERVNRVRLSPGDPVLGFSVLGDK